MIYYRFQQITQLNSKKIEISGLQMVLDNIVKLILCSSLLVISGQTTAAVYKWKDSSGLVHYSATRPQGIQYERMGVSTNSLSGQTANSPQKTSKSAAKSSANTKSQTGDEAKKDKMSAKEHASLCMKARKDIATLTNSGRLRVKQEDGSSTVMTDENRASRMKSMQAQASEHCK